MDSNWLRADLVLNVAFVKRLALAIARDENAADDLAQDVMRAALERAPDQRPGSIEAFRAWLSTVARRLAIDNARSESARRAREHRVSRPEIDDHDSDVVERMARSQRVVEAVMQLDEPYRSTVLLRYLEELTIAEVARRTNASELIARHVLKGSSLRTSKQPDTQWFITNTAALSDGSTGIYLREDRTGADSPWQPQEIDVFTNLLSGGVWKNEASPYLTIMMVNVDRYEEWLFERQADGRYAAMPRVERELKLECAAGPPTPMGWSVGWQWRDQWGTFANRGPRRVGAVVRMQASAPEGATFWWSNSSRPPGVLGAPTDVGGTCPLEGVRKFVLR